MTEDQRVFREHDFGAAVAVGTAVVAAAGIIERTAARVRSIGPPLSIPMIPHIRASFF